MSRGCGPWFFVGVCALLAGTSAGAVRSGPHAGSRPAIEVKVEVTEVDNLKASQLGVEWVDAIAVQEKTPPAVVSLGSFERLTAIHGDLHFLIEEGAAELLANPNLVTDSGTTATFHAGGEIPYVTNSSLGATHVEFKLYGVALDIKPRVVSAGLIQMQIRASVSAPDRTNGVLLSGNLVPALFEREVTSNVTVSTGSTVMLAGLVQTQKEETVKGVPFLRRLPLVGALFRWRTQTDRRTTVVIFMTPRVVDL